MATPHGVIFCVCVCACVHVCGREGEREREGGGGGRRQRGWVSKNRRASDNSIQLHVPEQ